jgi:hypothetical protein
MKRGGSANITTGTIGTYLAAAELVRHGFIVSALSQTAKGIDILAADPQTLQPLAIQVKTSRKGKREWMLRAAHEHIRAPGLFYILVDMPEGKAPEFHVVRSRVVADNIRKGHRRWKRRRGKHGQAHGVSDVRMFYDSYGKWLNRWDVLKADHQLKAR